MSIDGTEDIRSGVKRLLQRCLCANSEVAGCLLGLILPMRSADLLPSFAFSSDATLMLYVDENNRTTSQRTLADLVASTVADEKGSV